MVINATGKTFLHCTHRLIINEDQTMEQKMEPNGLRTESQAFVGGQYNNEGTPASISESVARSKDAIGAAASEAMNSASSDMQLLRNDLNSLRDTMSAFITQATDHATKSAREVASNVAGQVGDVASDLANRGANAASVAATQAKTFAGELENMARRNPLGAIAGAVLIGVLIGVMGRRK